jgi:hypothetical protein
MLLRKNDRKRKMAVRRGKIAQDQNQAFPIAPGRRHLCVGGNSNKLYHVNMVRLATIEDAETIAAIHVRTWQTAYEG